MHVAELFLGTRWIGCCGALLAFSDFGRRGQIHPLRLVAVLDHPRRWEWSRRVRITIAHTLVPLDVAGEVCIAGDDHFLALNVFVGRPGRASVGLGHRFGSVNVQSLEQLLLSRAPRFSSLSRVLTRLRARVRERCGLASGPFKTSPLGDLDRPGPPPIDLPKDLRKDLPLGVLFAKDHPWSFVKTTPRTSLC